MKRPLVLAIALPTAALAVWFGIRMTQEEVISPVSDPVEKAPDFPPATSTSTDAEEVFKRAFWKRPTDGDRILHAERREWTNADGVDRWQWFIAVDPSEELARYLNEKNPFRLSEPRGKVAIPTPPRPEWFPVTAEGFKVRQSRDGNMLFLTHRESGRLFATSQGRGFAKAVEVTPPAAPQSNGSGNPGRLPLTPPVPEER